GALREKPRVHTPAGHRRERGVRWGVYNAPLPARDEIARRDASSARGAKLGERGGGWVAGDAGVADEEVDLSRGKLLTGATIATGAVGVAFAAVPFIESWSPSERARAQGAPVELDISKIDPGQMAVPVWRKTPIYVVRRTPDMVAHVTGHDSELKDPK